MKRVLSILFMLLISICLFAAPTEKSMTTVFTADIECFAGFSKKNITNCVELKENESFGTGEVVSFKFDPVNNYYYTDVFWAYCQGFSRSKLIATVSAPDTLTNSIGEKIPFKPKDETTWIHKDSTWSFTANDTVDLKNPKPRVIMSKAIQLMATPSKLNSNINQNVYEVDFTITVKSVT